MSEKNFEQSYEIGFKLILHAGDAKSKAEEAIKLANNYKFDEAVLLIKEASNELKEAHKVQTDLIQAEANGSRYELNILLVHAQDHFAMALTAIDNAKQMLILNKKISQLEEQIKEKI